MSIMIMLTFITLERRKEGNELCEIFVELFGHLQITLHKIEAGILHE